MVYVSIAGVLVMTHSRAEYPLSRVITVIQMERFGRYLMGERGVPVESQRCATLGLAVAPFDTPQLLTP